MPNVEDMCTGVSMWRRIREELKGFTAEPLMSRTYNNIEHYPRLGRTTRLY